jgi:hypothetical protein
MDKNQEIEHKLVAILVDVHSKIVDTQPQLGPLFVGNFKVSNTVHLKVLGNVEVV